ncbi:hypothetical protein ACO1O0_003177 [Amphichorda felina]
MLQAGKRQQADEHERTRPDVRTNSNTFLEPPRDPPDQRRKRNTDCNQGLLIILLLYLYLRERRLRKRLEWRMTKAPGRITKSSSKVPHKTAPAVSRPLKPTAKGGGGGGGRTEKVRNIKPSTQLPPKVRLESAGWRPTIHQGIPRQPSRPTAAELEP